MSSMTDFGEQGFLNHALGGTPFGVVSQIHIALLTADPGESGTQTSEIGRVLMTGGFNAAASRTTSNAQLIPVDSTGWTDTNPIAYFALVEAASAGSYIWYGQLTQSISFTAGDQFEIPAGGITVTQNNTDTLPAFNVTDAAANLWIDHSLGTANWTQPAAQTVALYTDNPGQAGTANEFTGGGYARQSFTLDTLDTVAQATRGRNQNAMTFTNMQSPTLSWWGIWLDTTFGFTFDQPDRTVTPGSNIDVPVNRLEVLVT